MEEMTFGELYRKIRTEKGAIQQQAATASNISETTVSNIERNPSKLTIENGTMLINGLKDFGLTTTEERELKRALRATIKLSKDEKSYYPSGKVLKDILTDFKISQAKVGRAFGKSRQHINSYARGIDFPNAEAFLKIISFLQASGVTLSELRRYKVAYLIDHIERENFLNFLEESERKQVLKLISNAL